MLASARCITGSRAIDSCREGLLFVFKDTIGGPRAPAVKPGRITQSAQEGFSHSPVVVILIKHRARRYRGKEKARFIFSDDPQRCSRSPCPAAATSRSSPYFTAAAPGCVEEA